MQAPHFLLFLLLAVFAASLTGCAAIGDIFKAGAYTGIIAVVIIVVIIVVILFFIVGKMRGPRP